MKNQRTGFTLIELLVAITIGILVIGFGSVALNDFNEKQKVESVRQELLASLRLARNYAITEQFGSSVPSGTDRVVVTINPTSGLMVAKSKKGAILNLNDQTFFSKDITPNNVWITKDNPLDIEFTVTNGRLINGAVTIGVSGVVTKNIRIEDSGLIYGQ